jgi:uncharacterized membrane protein
MFDRPHPVRASPGSSGEAGRPSRPEDPALLTFKRLLMAGASAFLSVNLWTGSPLLALWLGSQVSQQETLSFKPIVVVIAALAVFTVAISLALGWLEAHYRRLVGLPLRESRLTWLRAFNAQREPVLQVPTSAIERIVTVVVYVAVIALIVWLVLFAGSPLPSPSQ